MIKTSVILAEFEFHQLRGCLIQAPSYLAVISCDCIKHSEGFALGYTHAWFTPPCRHHLGVIPTSSWVCDNLPFVSQFDQKGTARCVRSYSNQIMGCVVSTNVWSFCGLTRTKLSETKGRRNGIYKDASEVNHIITLGWWNERRGEWWKKSVSRAFVTQFTTEGSLIAMTYEPTAMLNCLWWCSVLSRHVDVEAVEMKVRRRCRRVESKEKAHGEFLIFSGDKPENMRYENVHIAYYV